MQRLPNIVLIYADDLGYRDVGCYGAQRIRTPNLDRMAAEGIRFTDHYAPAPTCTPSRAGLLTGCYPYRTGTHWVLFPKDDTLGLHPREVTIADMLKARGYATACYGKWHLGHNPAFLPPAHGFDEYLGIPYSNNMYPDWPKRDFPPLPLVEGTQTIATNPDQAQFTQMFTERATRFIREHRDQPFFIYLPHPMPHAPLFASERFKGQSAAGLYGDVIEELDWSVGVLLEELKQQGLDEQTLVLFTSDNGPWLAMGDESGSADPLRDGKFTTYEGGFRVPMIARWPGHTTAGQASSAIWSQIDLLPTFAALTGASLPTAYPIDGRDCSALLTEVGAPSPVEAFYYTIGSDVEAVRRGRWKYRHQTRKRMGKGPEEPQLFDLATDIGESRNLVNERPDLAAELRGQMDAFAADLAAQHRPGGNLETMPELRVGA